MTKIREISCLEELAQYRGAWEQLWRRTPDASFFQSLPWLECYWKHYGAGQKLRVLAVLDGNDPIGFLPLVVTRDATRVGRVRVLTYPLHGWGDTYGPVGPNPEAILAAGLDHVRHSRRDWEILELRWIGADASSTRRAMCRAGFQAHESVWSSSAVIDLDGTWDEYLASRTPKWRNNLRRWERRLAEQGELRHLRYRPAGAGHDDGDPRWDLYDICEEISRKSWQGSSTTGTTLSHESVRPFLRDVHAAAAASGGVDLNLLYLGDRPVAFAYNYRCCGRLYGLRVGFDPESAKNGAGNILYMYAIRDSFARGDAIYDLGPGSFQAKRYHLTRIVPTLRLSHFPMLSLRAQLLRAKRWARPAAGQPEAPAEAH